jgi:hypothetical protein
MLHSDLLDVLRKHVHAARDDHVLLAIDEMQIAVFVHHPDITRM